MKARHDEKEGQVKNKKKEVQQETNKKQKLVSKSRAKERKGKNKYADDDKSDGDLQEIEGMS